MALQGQTLGRFLFCSVPGHKEASRVRKLDRAKQALARLEQLRAALERLVVEKGLGHPDVLNVSQQVDEALNEYNRLTARRKRSRRSPQGPDGEGVKP